MALRKRPFIGTSGLRDSTEKLRGQEDGDCPKCGGQQAPSSIDGYLVCTSCSYEWPDPTRTLSGYAGPDDSIDNQSELVQQFKAEMESGDGISRVLGIDSQLSQEQEQSLGRLQDKWMSGLQGQFNPAEDERKPFIVNFDEEDNIISTDVCKLTIVNNEFDGGEEVRIEYPGLGTEFYTYEEDSIYGWNRGRSSNETARNIASIINRSSKLVHARNEANSVIFELRDSTLNPQSLVLYVEDPGDKDIIAQKSGQSLDPDSLEVEADYTSALKLMLEDGIITPSEDQLLWLMRQSIGITERRHIELIVATFGERALKECPDCSQLAKLRVKDLAWYCNSCNKWI